MVWDGAEGTEGAGIEDTSARAVQNVTSAGKRPYGRGRSFRYDLSSRRRGEGEFRRRNQGGAGAARSMGETCRY